MNRVRKKRNSLDMKTELLNKLYEAAPILYGMALKSPEWKIGLPDDLFPFLFELSAQIEKFNHRYRKRYVRVLKISIREAQLEFLTQRPVPAIGKLIAGTRMKIRQYRKGIRESYLERARTMHSTALFESCLLPDWKRVMPDELSTLRKILACAERFAISKGDWLLVANWYRKVLRDQENFQRCSEISRKCE